eukprot:Amastigsp_a340612_229.p5 type:complete len:120 gc:universal Amastigsp_a340612_229:88-447(+)
MLLKVRAPRLSRTRPIESVVICMTGRVSRSAGQSTYRCLRTSPSIRTTSPGRRRGFFHLPIRTVLCPWGRTVRFAARTFSSSTPSRASRKIGTRSPSRARRTKRVRFSKGSGRSSWAGR